VTNVNMPAGSLAGAMYPGGSGFTVTGTPDDLTGDSARGGVRTPAQGLGPASATANATKPTPQPVNYYAQYDAALAAARSNLEGQYVNAQNAIDTQQKNANTELATLPGKFSTIAGNEATNVGIANRSMLAADTAAGMGGGKGAVGATAAAQAEMNAARGQENAGTQSLVPSLGLGITTQMAAERAALNDAHQSALEQINQGAMSAAASRGDAAQAEANRRADATTQHGWDTQAATTAFNRQVTLASAAQGSQADKIIPSMTLGQVASVQHSPAYQNAVTLLTVGNGSGKPTTAKDVQSMYASNPQLLMVLARDFPTLFK